jgi:hypothetical protein
LPVAPQSSNEGVRPTATCSDAIWDDRFTSIRPTRLLATNVRSDQAEEQAAMPLA